MESSEAKSTIHDLCCNSITGITGGIYILQASATTIKILFHVLVAFHLVLGKSTHMRGKNYKLTLIEKV
jgi:hypothetical protein